MTAQTQMKSATNFFFLMNQPFSVALTIWGRQAGSGQGHARLS